MIYEIKAEADCGFVEVHILDTLGLEFNFLIKIKLLGQLKCPSTHEAIKVYFLLLLISHFCFPHPPFGSPPVSETEFGSLLIAALLPRLALDSQLPTSQIIP